MVMVVMVETKEKAMRTKTKTLRIAGATIIIDPNAGTLRPQTYVDAARLGVGYLPATTDEHERQRAARAAAVDAAIEIAGMPEYGWTWLDAESGHPLYFY